MSDLLRDLSYALRTLRKDTSFTITALLTLALGIGGTTAIFAIVDGVLLRPLEFDEPDRLVSIWPGNHPLVDFVEITPAESFVAVAAYDNGSDVTLTGAGEPARLRAVTVSRNLFATLGVSPQRGRLFSGSDGDPGAGKVAILSDRLWRNRFSRSPAAVGSSISLAGDSYTVVGVMPAGFRFPSAETDLWLPLGIDNSNVGAYWGSYFLNLIGRLAPSATTDSATTEVRGIAQRLRLDNPVWTPAEGYAETATVTSLQTEMSADLAPLLNLLLAAVLVVLLIVCVNLASLQLARSTRRRREAAVRASLGASRMRLLRLSLVESGLIAAAGAGLGVLGTLFVLDALLGALPGVEGVVGRIAVDLRVLGFATLLTALTTVGFGLAPALKTSIGELEPRLREAGRGPTVGRQRTRQALVLSQIALAVVLVVGSGLLLRSFWELYTTESGMETGFVFSARLEPAEGFYASPGQKLQLYRRLLDEVAALGGAASVAAAHNLPMTGANMLMAHRVEGRDELYEQGRLPTAHQRIVTPNYFRTLGIPLLEGRDFDGGDDVGAEPVVIVNRALADSVWPGESVLGKAVGYPWPSEWLRIVGVVDNVRGEALASEPLPAIYFPYGQRPMTAMTVLVRTSLDPGSFAQPLRAIVSGIDPQIPVSDLRTLDDIVWQSLAQPRFATTVLTVFAAVAVLLGAIGVFGVVNYVVEQRRHELGIRMALGASPARIRRSVTRQGVVLTGSGVLAGLVIATLAARGLRSQLFNVSELDPLVFAAAAVLLGLTALVATSQPARRAARISPLEAIRDD